MNEMSTDELRQMVREALRDLLPSANARPAPGAVSPFAMKLRADITTGRKVEVAIGSDAELTAFARDVAKAAELTDIRAASFPANSASPSGISMLRMPFQREERTGSTRAY